MKKTIAILLVLVLAGAGLFSAPNALLGIAGDDNSATLTLTTTVASYNLLAITVGEFTVAGATVASWNSHNATLIASPVTLSSGNIHGYLNVITNNRVGVEIFAKPGTLKSNATTVTNTYEIDYNLNVAGDTILASTSASRTQILTAAETKNDSGIFFGSYPIKATLVASTVAGNIENAPEDTYVGDIIFTFQSI